MLEDGSNYEEHIFFFWVIGIGITASSNCLSEFFCYDIYGKIFVANSHGIIAINWTLIRRMN